MEAKAITSFLEEQEKQILGLANAITLFYMQFPEREFFRINLEVAVHGLQTVHSAIQWANLTIPKEEPATCGELEDGA